MCENCKFYQEVNKFFGKCDKIKMMIYLENPAPEFEDIRSFTNINVRKEFKCNKFQY